MPLPRPIKIGTRGSPLALWQAEHVRDRLAALRPELAEPGALEVTPVKTTGDKVQDRPLSEIGGKGLFTKEIDRAQMDGRIDIAVHCVKDLPTYLAGGIVTTAVLEREDPRDVFISKSGAKLADLPAGGVVGTTSLRRQAQILARHPKLRVVSFRGNVQTRLRKLDEGQADGTMLALSGLIRLGMTDVATETLAPEDMLPAVGQGTLTVACREDDEELRDLVSALHHAESAIVTEAERAMLRVLDGSCRTPIAGYAELTKDGLRLRGLVARPDGSEVWRGERSGAPSDAEAVGEELGRALRAEIGEEFFADLADEFGNRPLS